MPNMCEPPNMYLALLDGLFVLFLNVKKYSCFNVSNSWQVSEWHWGRRYLIVKNVGPVSKYNCSIINLIVLLQLAAKYDPDVEAEVIGWFKELLGADLTPGMREIEKQLRDGILLAK